MLTPTGTPLAELQRRPAGARPTATPLEQRPPGTGRLAPPHESLRAPAIGDIDGDHEPEIVAAAGEHVYAWDLDGTPAGGLPGRRRPRALGSLQARRAAPLLRRRPIARSPPHNHIKRGFFGSPALADLDGDGDARHRRRRAGPARLRLGRRRRRPARLPGRSSRPTAPTAPRSSPRPAIAHLDGHGHRPEIVIATNEVDARQPELPDRRSSRSPTRCSARRPARTPSTRSTATARPVAGWPVEVGVAAGDLLPLVLPGHDAAVLDTDGDGNDEVSVSAAPRSGPAASGSSTATARRVTGYAERRPGRRSRPRPGPQPRRLPVDRRPRRRRHAGGDQGRPDPERRREPARGQPEPAVQPRRVRRGTRRRALAAAGLPAGRPTTSSSSRSRRSPGSAGIGPGRQALVGTGLYQLHAYGPAGSRPPAGRSSPAAGSTPTPCVGDADGDGKLDVTALTREGWQFLWDTGRRRLRRLQRRVVDLPPRRALDGQLRRTTPARPGRSATSTRQRARARRPVTARAGPPRATTGSAAAPRSVPRRRRRPDRRARRRHRGRRARRATGAGRDAGLADPERGRDRRQHARRRPVPRRGRQLGPASRTRASAHADGRPPPPGADGADGPTGPGGPPRQRRRACATHIDGTAGKDRLERHAPAPTGSAASAAPTGSAARGGDDCASGQGGADRVAGGAGDDELKGGRGRDRISGGRATTRSAPPRRPRPDRLRPRRRHVYISRRRTGSAAARTVRTRDANGRLSLDYRAPVTRRGQWRLLSPRWRWPRLPSATRADFPYARPRRRPDDYAGPLHRRRARRPGDLEGNEKWMYSATAADPGLTARPARSPRQRQPGRAQRRPRRAHRRRRRRRADRLAADDRPPGRRHLGARLGDQVERRRAR